MLLAAPLVHPERHLTGSAAVAAGYAAGAYSCSGCRGLQLQWLQGLTAAVAAGHLVELVVGAGGDERRLRDQRDEINGALGSAGRLFTRFTRGDAQPKRWEQGAMDSAGHLFSWTVGRRHAVASPIISSAATAAALCSLLSPLSSLLAS